jgi:hypothetical protein
MITKNPMERKEEDNEQSRRDRNQKFGLGSQVYSVSSSLVAKAAL